jgi:hypothetical protein
MPVRIGFGEEFGKESTVVQHINGSFTVNIRIDTVQSVSKDSHGGKVVGQGSAMGMDINAISQTADYQHIRIMRGKITQEIYTELLAILCGIASTDHIDDTKTIEIGMPFEEEDYRSVFTFAQTRRISFIFESQTSEAILLHELHFVFGMQESGRIIEGSNYSRTHTG